MAQKKVEILTQIRGLNDEDLTKKIEDDKVRLNKMSFSHAIQPLENSRSIRFLRKNIARMLTEKKQRELNKK